MLIIFHSTGELPDFRPKPGDDGTCFVYTTKPDDTCSKLAAANSLKASDILILTRKPGTFLAVIARAVSGLA